MVREEYPEASKTAADEMLPRWLGAMQGLVGNLDSLHRLGSGNAEEKDWEYLAVLNECWKVSVKLPSKDPRESSAKS